ncbi:MAG TPA: M48 family metalloprotease [Polyangiaceae bacterium]|nr:M48 family metalloprotease [Polyangiaceae bacterium]
MSVSFLALCVCAVATLAYTCSLVTLPAVLAVRRGVLALAPRAESRLLFALAVLPLVVSISALAASLVPSPAVDHCFGDPDPHAHQHLCSEHHPGVFPTGVPLLLGACLLVSIGFAMVRMPLDAQVGRRLSQGLGRVARVEADYRVLPFSEPQAFLIGAVRPQLFVTEGLLTEHAEHLDVVLGHERAHLLFRHALLRTLAKAALCFHLPVLSHLLERSLDLAHEMSADEEAALRVGSRERVASALLQLTRATLPLPSAMTGFGCSHIEQRVTRLLDARATLDMPSVRSLLLVSALALLALTIAAEPVHHGLEMTLGLLGS